MIDTHAHLHAKAFDADRDAALARAFAAGLSAILEVNIDRGGWPHAERFAARDPRVFLTVGIHPHDTGRASEQDLEDLFAHVGDPKIRAVGETGLDYFRNYAPHDIQRDFFARHVELARETGLPLVVHVRQQPGERGAHEDAIAILRREGRGRVRGVFHCFSGGIAEAREAVALGFRLGIGGAVTYSPARSGPLLRAIAAELGPEVFLLETDCPYLTPHPRRRDRNEPAYLPLIADALAAALGTARDEVEALTDRSARELFRLEP